MKNARDDFSLETKRLLANRVGMKCSNPKCQKVTCCASTDPNGVTNIGVAAHICAAAKMGQDMMKLCLQRKGSLQKMEFGYVNLVQK